MNDNPSASSRQGSAMFSNSTPRLASLAVFARRLWKAVLASTALIMAALLMGVLGYHWIAQLGWVDSLLNASMILGGMGPVDQLHGDAAKLFASFYALFSGLIFIGAISLIVAPVFHRTLHKFHIDDQDLDAEESPPIDRN